MRRKKTFWPIAGLTMVILAVPLRAEKAERFLVRITSTPERMAALSRMPIDFVSMALKTPRDAVVTEKELASLLQEGYRVEILQRESDLAGQPLDAFYHTLEETHDYLHIIAGLYPHIARLHNIGRSTRFSLPILALKISDNPDEDEDEPAFLVDAMHHAREPLGNEIALAFIEYLVSRYGWDARVTSWVDGFEIWVIPILNPEGYKYIVDNNLASPWWRKNLRDNDQNGAIDLDYDGVDLNRNYSLNWTYAGSANPADWTYRGPAPFSEDETKAKRDLALRERFAAAITYHSYGEIIYYQWSWPSTGARAPDHNLLQRMASELAARIRNLAGTGTYAYGRQTAANQSSPWIYSALGTLEFLVETGTSFIPLETAVINHIVEANLEGLFTMLERLAGPGITGRILCRKTLLPVEASVSIVEIDNFAYIEPRTTHPLTGRFLRLLEPGKYTLQVLAPGYNRSRIKVNIGDRLLEKDILLVPCRDREPADRLPRK
ncbi:MAG: hypothetical protein FJY81_03275 [Candidatus Aminicenantes bacterium]|nr:hypothetical protein [Candidatus Aminicenantes bacterium]